MATVNVKVPDEMKQKIKEMASEKHYQNESEYVRDAIRSKIQEDTGLTLENYKEVLERIKQLEEDEVDLLDEEEVKKELDIE